MGSSVKQIFNFLETSKGHSTIAIAANTAKLLVILLSG